MISRIDTLTIRRAGVLADPRALAAALGLDRRAEKQKRNGLKICCPWHSEKNPSCSLTKGDDGTIRVHCFSCGESGDALDLVATANGLDARDDFLNVVEIAAGLANVELPDREAAPEEKEPTISSETFHQIWTHVLDGCPFSNAPSVANYLYARGVFEDAEAVDLRGYPSDARAIVADLLATFERADLEAAGVLRRGKVALDWPAWSLLIPWRDRFGRIVCVQRRRLVDEKPKYRVPPGISPSAPFGVDIFKDALGYGGPDAEVVIVEGALDALAYRRFARETNRCVGVLGIYSATTPTVGLPLDLFSGRKIVVATDADDAGDKAGQALCEAMPDDVLDVTRERPPQGFKDWATAAAISAWRR